MSEAQDQAEQTNTTTTPAQPQAPQLPYRPIDPRAYRPAIGLIGCGGITASHLSAYKAAGYNVVVLCDMIESRARERQAAFYPDADVTTDLQDVLRRDDVEVVDIATHPLARQPVVEAGLMAGKHVLSQKPFALDLDWGERMVELADRQGVRLAVNQNGRWAPHWSYIRQAINHGVLGEVICAHLAVQWNHEWIIGTPFEEIHDVILYDFAIHWFDIVSSFLGDRVPRRVYATTGYARGQRSRPPMLAQAAIDYDGAQATLVFDAAIQHGSMDRTYVGGTAGSISSSGPTLNDQQIILSTAAGASSPVLEGAWFPDGFHGTMAELLCAIEEGREPSNSARNNIRSLELAFAAIASAHDGEPKVPGTVRRLPED